MLLLLQVDPTRCVGLRGGASSQAAEVGFHSRATGLNPWPSLALALPPSTGQSPAANVTEGGQEASAPGADTPLCCGGGGGTATPEASTEVASTGGGTVFFPQALMGAGAPGPMAGTSLMDGGGGKVGPGGRAAPGSDARGAGSGCGCTSGRACAGGAVGGDVGGAASALLPPGAPIRSPPPGRSDRAPHA